MSRASEQRTVGWSRRRALLALTLLPLLGACDLIRRDAAFTLPPIETIDSIYREQGLDVRVRYSGNVVELHAVQPIEQLERGGTLWARVGPYIHLFTPATQHVFTTWAGVAGVRAITTTASDDEIARALLVRAELDDARWRRANNLLALALHEGTERPRRIEALVFFGEDHTEHSYNPRYVPRDSRRDER